MESTSDVFERVTDRLRILDRKDAAALRRWSATSPLLATSALSASSEVPVWVWGLRRKDADDVVRVLVRHAQADDEAAVLAVLVCLRPGLVKLGSRLPVPLDDVVNEAVVQILSVRLEARRRVIGGLLLDIRKQFWRAACRQPRQVLVDPYALAAYESRPAGLRQAAETAGEELAEVVADAWRRGRIDADEARLIVETRVLGDTVGAAARRRRQPRRAVSSVRERAESRLRLPLAAA